MWNGYQTKLCFVMLCFSYMIWTDGLRVKCLAVKWHGVAVERKTGLIPFALYAKERTHYSAHISSEDTLIILMPLYTLPFPSILVKT